MADIQLKPCTREHIERIRTTRVQEDDAKHTKASVADILNAGIAFSAWLDGQCLGAGGVFQHWPGRAEAWLYLDIEAQPHIRRLLRPLRFMLDSHPCRRIEMTALVDNPAGHRIASLLGFEREGLLKGYHPNGQDVVMYARLKTWR